MRRQEPKQNRTRTDNDYLSHVATLLYNKFVPACPVFAATIALVGKKRQSGTKIKLKKIHCFNFIPLPFQAVAALNLRYIAKRGPVAGLIDWLCSFLQYHVLW